MQPYFRRVLLHVFLCVSLPAMAWADDDSRFTGDTVGAPSVSTSPVQHRVKKKAAESPSATDSTNAVVDPAVTNLVASPSVSTNETDAPVAPTETNTPTAVRTGDGRVATLAVSELQDFEADSPQVQRLLTQALALTTQNLSYKYGSDDPQNGGMDCSGTVYYLLTQAGLADVPRDASEMYRWVWTRGDFRCVVSSRPDTFELDRLKPGDLLFWSGTYRVDRDPPITHVMIYLGLNRATGRRVMVGASEGRRFNDKSCYGVSVFDFVLPRPGPAPSTPDGSSELQARFVGYGTIPGLEAARGQALPK